jgi:RNA binding exosome subunit
VSSRTPKGFIEVRVFAHATEDEEKVLAAVRHTLPKELGESAIFQKTSLVGHHGNPIFLFGARLTEKQALPLFLEKIAKHLSSLDKDTLEREIKLHMEKRNLFLRLDKQSAYVGELKLSSSDPVHFKIHFRDKTPQEIIDICRNAGLLP